MTTNLPDEVDAWQQQQQALEKKSAEWLASKPIEDRVLLKALMRLHVASMTDFVTMVVNGVLARQHQIGPQRMNVARHLTGQVCAPVPIKIKNAVLDILSTLKKTTGNDAFRADVIQLWKCLKHYNNVCDVKMHSSLGRDLATNIENIINGAAELAAKEPP